MSSPKQGLLRTDRELEELAKWLKPGSLWRLRNDPFSSLTRVTRIYEYKHKRDVDYIIFFDGDEHSGALPVDSFIQLYAPMPVA